MSVRLLSRVSSPMFQCQHILILTQKSYANPTAGADTVRTSSFFYCRSLAASAATPTFATLQAAFLAISLNPDILKKAHEELDAVVGPHRLPNFDDQDSLDYVNAIAFEALRWHNVVPLGVPHKTIADDELGGYFIPAGTIVMANTWYVLSSQDARAQLS